MVSLQLQLFNEPTSPFRRSWLRNGYFLIKPTIFKGIHIAELKEGEGYDMLCKPHPDLEGFLIESFDYPKEVSNGN